MNRIRDYLASRTPRRRARRDTAMPLPAIACERLEARRHLTLTPGATLQVGEQPFEDGRMGVTAVAGDDLFYVAVSDQQLAREALWVKDGATGIATRLVEGIGDLSALTAVGNTAYFRAEFGASSVPTLYKTDGTFTGTKEVKTFSGTSGAWETAAGNGVLYFIPGDGDEGVWRTDGTANGTVQLVATSFTNRANSLKVVNGTAYFLAGGLWRSDGTVVTTTKLKSLSASSLSGPDEWIAAADDGTIYFAGKESGVTVGLYASNGTAATTRLVKSAPLTDIDELTTIGNALYFVGDDDARSYELWRSDGTTAGTDVVKEIAAGGSSSLPQLLTPVGDTLYFTAASAGVGRELWKSDGTESGTSLVKDVITGSGNPSIADLTNVGGTLYFSAVEPASGRELWRSDGTETGTTLVRDMYPGAGGSSPTDFVVDNGTLLFRAVDPVGGAGLFRQTFADPLPAPALAGDLIPGPLNPRVWAEATPDGRYYFAGGDGSSTGRELFASDGTPGNVALVTDVFPGLTGSNPTYLTALGNSILFAGDGQNLGRELFKSDGTAGGTGLVKNIFSNSTTKDTASSDPFSFFNVNGLVYFSANESSTAERLYRTDGTEAGTVVFGPNPATKVIAHNGGIYAGSFNNYPISARGLIYTARPTNPSLPQDNVEPHTSANGTTFTLLRDINPDGNAARGSSSPREFVAVGSRLFFTATNVVNGRELWKTDGTTAGTVMVKDILPPERESGLGSAGMLGSRPSALIGLNGRLIFLANDGLHGQEFWVSDGTDAGTQLMVDLRPGIASPQLIPWLVVGNRLYFTADDGVSGQELWATDGTAAGTFQVADINPGPGSSSPSNPVDVNGVLTFTANDGVAGVRLYTVELPPAPAVPGRPDLLPAADTGSSDADNVTRRDNGEAGKELQFAVDGTVAGATVTIYADGVAIGSTVAEGASTVVVTNGASDLADGARSITARQTEPGKAESLGSEPLEVTIDTAVPTVDITDVSPDPRSTGVSFITIRFSRAVSGFDLADLSLTRDGGPNLLMNQSLTTSPFVEPNMRFTLGGLSLITAIPGTYRLTLNLPGSDIADSLAGNPLGAGAEDVWTHAQPAWLAPGSAATWNSSNKSLTVTGAATITADPGADSPVITADGASAVLTINPSAGRVVHVGGLTLTHGATATLTSVTAADAATAAPANSSPPAVRGGGGKGNAKPKDKLTSVIAATAAAVRTAANSRVLVINGNTFNIDAGSTLDLVDNNLILNYSGASPAAEVEGMVKAGFNGGDWLGKRITSSSANANRSFALAVADNARLGIAFGDGTSGRLFAGEAVDTTAMLVKFTHRVDLDLDGVITTNDATTFNSNYTEGAAARWAFGDVDFDGLFTTNDATFFNGYYDESLGAM